MRAVRGLAILLHAILGCGALAAGQSFVRDPSGGGLGMDADWLTGSPFPDFRVPGLFLVVVIGGANLLSGWTLFRRSPLGPLCSLATGVLLIVWVVIQTAIIGYRHPSQLIWFVTFPLVALLGAILTWESRRGMQPSPA